MTLLQFSKYSLVILLLSVFMTGKSQELNCNVQVSAQQVQGSNRQIFETMQRDIYEFMNNTVWSNHLFNYSERIDCNILININDQLSADEFRGTIQIQLRRPVYITT
jgi:hypothetical protein